MAPLYSGARCGNCILAAYYDDNEDDEIPGEYQAFGFRVDNGDFDPRSAGFVFFLKKRKANSL